MVNKFAFTVTGPFSFPYNNTPFEHRKKGKNKISGNSAFK